MTEEAAVPEDLLELTTQIVSAYVSNNPVNQSGLGDMIRDIYGVLSEIEKGENKEEKDLTPAVPIKKSVTPEHIICLEDGKKLKMLKRYLRTQYGLSPEEYRARWGLPHDYPMVAPNYANQRSKLAKKIGLGKQATGRPRK